MCSTILLDQLELGYFQNQNQAKIYISQQKDLFISYDPLKSRTRVSTLRSLIPLRKEYAHTYNYMWYSIAYILILYYTYTSYH